MTTTRAPQADTIAEAITAGLLIASEDRHRPGKAEAGELARAQRLAIIGTAEYIRYGADADWATYFAAYPRPQVRETAVPLAIAWLTEQAPSTEPVCVGREQTTVGQAATALLDLFRAL